jgi:hypothetical protein
MQIACVAFLEPAVGQALCPRASVPRFDQIARDIDAENVGAQPGRRQGRRPVAAAQVQYLQSRGDAEAGDERLTAPAHACRDPGEVALFPQCLVRIHVTLPLQLGACCNATRFLMAT